MYVEVRGVRKKLQQQRVQQKGVFGCVKTSPSVNGRRAGVIHFNQMRPLSVREFLRAQSFPDTFQLCGCLPCLLKRVGNALPPLLAYEVFSMLKLALSST